LDVLLIRATVLAIYLLSFSTAIGSKHTTDE